MKFIITILLLFKCALSVAQTEIVADVGTFRSRLKMPRYTSLPASGNLGNIIYVTATADSGVWYRKATGWVKLWPSLGGGGSGGLTIRNTNGTGATLAVASNGVKRIDADNSILITPADSAVNFKVDTLIIATNNRVNQAIDSLASTISAGGITQLTGDVTAGSGSGSQVATIAANAVTVAKMQQIGGLSVLGNSTNSIGNMADIAASTNHQVLRRTGTTIGFGTLNAAALNPTYTNGYMLSTDGNGNPLWVAANNLIIDSLPIVRYGYLFAQNIRSWNSGPSSSAAQFVASANTTTSNDSSNIALGYEAMNEGTMAYRNILIGPRAGRKITTSFGNIGIGFRAVGGNGGATALTGKGNIGIGTHEGIGVGALGSNTSGQYNIAIGGNAVNVGGSSALANNTTGSLNTAVGNGALGLQTTASSNTGFGYGTLALTTTGGSNTAIGDRVLESNTTGVHNAGFGAGAGGHITTGQYNIAIGSTAMSNPAGSGSNHTGSYNVAIGNLTLAYIGSSFGNVSHNRNTVIGAQSLRAVGTSTNDNTFIGYGSSNAASTVVPFTGNNNIGIGSFNIMPNLSANNQIQFWVGASGGYNALTRFATGQWLLNNTITAITSAPNTSAAFEINGTTGAFILPRLTAAQAAVLTAANAMMIYVTDTDATFTSIGFWGYQNGAWVKL